MSYEDEPQVSGFIIIHSRMGGDVIFGPFATLDELHKWVEEVGIPNRVAGAIKPLMNPKANPRNFWWIPDDIPWEETLKPEKDREYIP